MALQTYLMSFSIRIFSHEMEEEVLKLLGFRFMKGKIGQISY